MLRGAIWVLRQRRYVMFAALMVVVAAGCAVAGTWQIQRFNTSVRENRALRTNAEAPITALGPAVAPVRGPAPSREQVTYRHVRVTGRYVAGADQFLSNRFVGQKAGFDVLTPLTTPTGTLVVDRGFIGARRNGAPKPAPAAPTGQVTVTGRLQAVSTSGGGADAQGVVSAVVPRGADSYRAYLTLDQHQAGGHGLVAASAPNLTNPAGGAYEWQHFAYIIQWYAFGLLALAAPFYYARNEVREARKRWLGIDPAAVEFDEIDAPQPAAIGSGSNGALPVLREGAELARADLVTPERLDRARKLADRYGRSLGPDDGASLLSPKARRGGRAIRPVVNSAHDPHRSEDQFHAAYNDYLWQLAMADGDLPKVYFDDDSAEKSDSE